MSQATSAVRLWHADQDHQTSIVWLSSVTSERKMLGPVGVLRAGLEPAATTSLDVKAIAAEDEHSGRIACAGASKPIDFAHCVHRP